MEVTVSGPRGYSRPISQLGILSNGQQSLCRAPLVTLATNLELNQTVTDTKTLFVGPRKNNSLSWTPGGSFWYNTGVDPEIKETLKQIIAVTALVLAVLLIYAAHS